MSRAHAVSALRQYGTVGAASAVEGASPHRLIQMLMAGAMSRIATASGQMLRGDTAGKGKSIGLAISIIDGLRASLDFEVGGEIAANLEALYDYMGRRLLEANLHDDAASLDEVHELLATLKKAWDELPAHLPEEAGATPQLPERRARVG